VPEDKVAMHSLPTGAGGQEKTWLMRMGGEENCLVHFYTFHPGFRAS